MKKLTLVNLIVIIGLLILSVMTLTAIYATIPESSVLLLDENFAELDKNKWRHEIVECAEDGNHYQYEATDRFTADGTLHVLSNLTSPEFRIKREALRKCDACANSSLFAASLVTKNIFHADSGIITVRAKFQEGNRLRFRIAIISNDSESEDIRTYDETSKTREENFGQLEISFVSNINRTVLKSAVADNNFHIYEIEWNPEKIALNADHQKVDEKTFKLYDQVDNSTSSKSPVAQPFYLRVEVSLGEKLENSEIDSNTHGRHSAETKSKENNRFDEESIFEIDYIRLFRTEISATRNLSDESKKSSQYLNLNVTLIGRN